MRPTLKDRIAVRVGDALRQLRIRAGFSAGRLAWLMGSHRPIISRTEGGHHLPTLEVAVRSAMLCGGSARDIGVAIDKAMADEARATTGDVLKSPHHRPLRRVPRRVAARAVARVLVTPVTADAALEPQTLH